MKSVAPKILDAAAEFYPTVFPSLNAGCTFVLDAFPTMYRRTIRELKSHFTTKELSLMRDVSNGHMMTPSIAGVVLYQQCIDGIELDSLDDKWGIHPGNFLRSLNELTVHQSACLELWATGFWSQANNDDAVTMEKYVMQLVGE